MSGPLLSIVIPAVLVGAMREGYARTDLRLRLQTWQLEQLVRDARRGPASAGAAARAPTRARRSRR